MTPPPYPRTPHLWPVPGSAGRLVLPPDEAQRWLQVPIVVEEKLDGANVALWFEEPGSELRVASRGGPEARDRAGQLGRLRAWSAERRHELGQLLKGGWALYAEWLWLEHGVHYDRLSDLLVALDLWHPERGFAPLEERDRRCQEAGLVLPPRLFQGVLGSHQRLRDLIQQSRFSSSQSAEGLILRTGDSARCKLVAAGHVRRSDEDWLSERKHNEVAAGHPTGVGSTRGFT